MRRISTLMIIAALLALPCLAEEEAAFDPPAGFDLNQIASEAYMKAVQESDPVAARIARTAWSEVAAAQPDDVSARMALTILDLLDTSRSLEQLLELEDSFSAGQYFQTANLVLRMGDAEQAVPLYEKAIEANPKWPCPRRHLGEALELLHRLPEAEAAYLASIEIQPEHWHAYTDLARMRLYQGREKEARRTLEGAITLAESQDQGMNREMETVYRLLADLYQKRGKTKNAQKLAALAEELAAQDGQHLHEEF